MGAASGGPDRPSGGTRLRAIERRLTTLAGLLGLALAGYVSFGSGGAGGGSAVVISVALLLLGLRRARQDPEQAALVDRMASRAVMLLPGALVVYLGFSAGGFFPGPTALAAVLLGLLLAARLVLGAGADLGGRLPAVIAAGLAGYTGWVLLSGSWSGAPERALTEADLALVYGLAFVLFAASVTGWRDLRWIMGGLAAGASVVCLGAFLSRAQPLLWPIAASLDTPRVSYPLTYWNGLGLVAGMGILVCLGLTSDDRGSPLTKALSALPIPLMGVALLLTFSRGAIVASLVGLAVYVVFGRPRSLLSAAIAVGPPTAYALISAYDATSLAKALDGTAVQVAQGHHLARVVAACAAAAAVMRGILAVVDRSLVRLSDRRPVSATAARRTWGVAVGLAVVASLALGLPAAVARQYDRFVQGNHSAGAIQVRDRLTDPGADGRITLWRVAIAAFHRAPVAGTGAGTFELTWNAGHPASEHQVLDAHSIYLENLSELGAVGFGLLVAVVLGLLLGIARRMRGPPRALYAAVFAVAVAWAVRAGGDWDWELPAVTLPVFVLAGAALARSGTEPGRRRRRPGLAILVLVAAAAPALLSVSQTHLDTSLAAFESSDCATATAAARSALRPLGLRRAPHEIIAYCDAARGAAGPAADEMRLAVAADPKNWETAYGLAVVRAIGGRDPRRQVRAALALNPYEPVIVDLARQFRADPPSRWEADAAAAPLPIGGQYGQVIAALRASAPAGGAGPARPGRPR